MTLHRGPRNSNPLEAVAQRRHAELDAQFDQIIECCPQALNLARKIQREQGGEIVVHDDYPPMSVYVTTREP